MKSEKEGKKDKLKAAKILILQPIIVFVVLLVCFIVAVVLEEPTGRGFLYSLLSLVAILGAFICPFICGLGDVIGLSLLLAQLKKGEDVPKWLFIVGALEVCVSILMVWFWFYFITQRVPMI